MNPALLNPADVLLQKDSAYFISYIILMFQFKDAVTLNLIII